MRTPDDRPVRTLLRYLLLACLIVPLPSQAAEGPPPEHTVWIRLETIPNGATIYAPPPEGEQPTIRIGVTPCVVAVDLRWKVTWFIKRWERMLIWSPGNICNAVFQPDGSYELNLSFVPVLDGYKEEVVNRRVLSLMYPGRKWQGKDLWPKQTKLLVELEPDNRTREPHHAAPVTKARKVILADDRSVVGDGTSGTLTITSNAEDSRAFVDTRYVGDTPVQVILREGGYVVQVQSPGYYPVRREIFVNDDAEVTYRASLKPLVE